jgi:hypothetical protein
MVGLSIQNPWPYLRLTHHHFFSNLDVQKWLHISPLILLFNVTWNVHSKFELSLPSNLCPFEFWITTFTKVWFWKFFYCAAHPSNFGWMCNSARNLVLITYLRVDSHTGNNRAIFFTHWILQNMLHYLTWIFSSFFNLLSAPLLFIVSYIWPSVCEPSEGCLMHIG